MNNHITEELLVKYLLDEASEAEQAQVQNWIGQSEENRKEYYRFKTIWEESRFVAASSTVDENAAWDKFKMRTRQQPVKTVALPGRYAWVKVAAALIILIGGSLLAYNNYFNDDNSTQITAANTNSNPVNVRLPHTDGGAGNNIVQTQTVEDDALQQETTPVVTNMPASEKPVAEAKPTPTRFMEVTYQPPLGKGTSHPSRKSICNATPCPLEICIIQKVKCPGDNEPAAISTCSVLEPDESGQLHYKSFEHITNNCNNDIEEIRIRRVSTGETIVLNAHSRPATAKDFFSYINGEKKGDILAGMFHKDCNNRADDCGLIFNNDYGIIMQ
ncbi:MAG: hypothetical protein K0Q79_3512 [Flavipsychrobacter sp.]|jgi:hypothetical protein|nr:hypothetical protein [Flavipsychrobacter sp.]